MVGGEISTGLQIKIVVSVFMCMLTVDSGGGGRGVEGEAKPR